MSSRRPDPTRQQELRPAAGGLRQGRRGQRRRAGQSDRAQHSQGHVRVPAAAGAGDEAAVLAPEALLRRAPAVSRPQPRLRVPGAGRTGAAGDDSRRSAITWACSNSRVDLHRLVPVPRHAQRLPAAPRHHRGEILRGRLLLFLRCPDGAAAHRHVQRHVLQRRRACAVSSTDRKLPSSPQGAFHEHLLPAAPRACDRPPARLRSAAWPPIARLRPRAPRSTSCRRRTAPRSKDR